MRGLWTVKRPTMSGNLATSMARVFEADPAGLLAAVRRGDAAAQGEFFEQHKQSVANQILRMTGEPAWVDELVREVFIAVFGRREPLGGHAGVHTWLHRITTDKVRGAWNARPRGGPLDGRAPSDETAQGKLNSFYRALGDLPPKYRDAFVCRALEDMSLQQASDELGVPISTVSYRARRAEELLCEALGMKGLV